MTIAESIAFGRVTPFQSRITEKEKVAALTQKVAQLKEKIDNLKQKPKKTVKKKAANASTTPSGEHLNVPIKSSQDVPIPMSNQPPRPGAVYLHDPITVVMHAGFRACVPHGLSVMSVGFDRFCLLNWL